MTIQELDYLIDHAVNPIGGDPKIKGPALNALLKSLAAEFTTDAAGLVLGGDADTFLTADLNEPAKN
jgi:hypothetical protein